MEPGGLGIGNAWRSVGRAHETQEPDQGVVFIAERPELEAMPCRLTAHMENQRGSSRRLAGQRLRGWMETRRQIGQIAHSCRTVSLTRESHHRVSRITGQVFPGT